MRWQVPPKYLQQQILFGYDYLDCKFPICLKKLAVNIYPVAFNGRVVCNGRAVCSGKVVFNVPRHHEVEYGDRLLITGSLETPPILGEYDYREYLASRGVRSLMRQPRVTRLRGRNRPQGRLRFGKPPQIRRAGTPRERQSRP